ncbi:DUF397 domain-containing protein [Streptomyces sp. CNQ085]|uniref:DUF397 domain-containing protein n=1 Tax=Streptomyces sp. CNQ085 TaxID=2886944 RepID=UPI001F5074B2|nr:DUF397 domain-containing protein [Streptomyces sp. CNQ085]MCI0385940.1 DUF397 domain-containing protein [Streptomyces sp. CNQ085]
MRPAISGVPDNAWVKSSYSGAGATECVEVALIPEGTAVRDSKERDGGVLLLSPAAWDAFASRLKDHLTGSVCDQSQLDFTQRDMLTADTRVHSQGQ